VLQSNAKDSEHNVSGQMCALAFFRGHLLAATRRLIPGEQFLGLLRNPWALVQYAHNMAVLSSPACS